jgi:acetolactate synthase-1/2/3 large subunit
VEFVFCVTGGYAQNLNRSFGSHPKLTVIYSQTEVGAGYAAVGYAKLTGKVPVVCVTAGCGATNPITAIQDAYQDSVPVFVISGQVNSSEVLMTKDRRHYMGAWGNIVDIVKPITKMVVEPLTGKDAFDVVPRLWNECVSGRPGPVWLSCPLDIQRTEGQFGLLPTEEANASIHDDEVKQVLDLLENSKRPVILLGNGARCCGKEMIDQFIRKVNVPTLLTFLSLDLLESDHPLHCGRPGVVGDRCGNMCMQNADLILALGCRIAGMIVGYNATTFAREAKIISVNIDERDFASLRPGDIGIKADLNWFLPRLLENSKYNIEEVSRRPHDDWTQKVSHWKRKWFRDLPTKDDESLLVNPYHFLHGLCEQFPANTSFIHASGSTFPIAWHVLNLNRGQRFISSSQGDMGFELPAGVGVALRSEGPTVILVGDGSFHFCAPELQTLKRVAKLYQRQIAIILLDNNGLVAISIAQQAAFKKTFGSDSQSGFDLPDLKRLTEAYDIAFYDNITNPNQITMPQECGVFVFRINCTAHGRHPRLAVTYDSQGNPKALPLEDMAPLLDWDEFAQEMQVKPAVDRSIQ